MKVFPVQERAGRVTMAWAASAMMSGFRLRSISSAPTTNSTAAVAIVVRGHSAFDAMPASASSPAMPMASIAIAYFDAV